MYICWLQWYMYWMVNLLRKTVSLQFLLHKFQVQEGVCFLLCHMMPSQGFSSALPLFQGSSMKWPQIIALCPPPLTALSSSAPLIPQEGQATRSAAALQHRCVTPGPEPQNLRGRTYMTSDCRRVDPARVDPARQLTHLSRGGWQGETGLECARLSPSRNIS